MMKIKELRAQYGLTQKALSELTGIPKRTIEEWEGERRTPPDYVLMLLTFFLANEKDGK